MIEIACQTDARLLPDCAVMLHSLLSTNPDDRFRIHFLHEAGAPRDLWAPLVRIVVSFGSEWSPTPIDPERLAKLPFDPGYGGYAACYRLLLPRLLPDVSKVLYLDADIIVLDRVLPLWEIDMDGCCVAATTNPLYRLMEQRVKTKLGLPDRRAYFNSGVLLLDLDTLRTQGLDSELVDWAAEHRDSIAWPDQDVLNAVLWRYRLPLHPRWNASSGLWDLPRRDLPWTEDEVAEARRDPAIAHFLGPFKPWHYRCTHPRKAAYSSHLAPTGLPSKVQEGRTLRNRIVRRLPALAQWTVENGAAELKAEVKHHLLSTDAGREARTVYRKMKGRHPGPVPVILEALDATVDDVVFVQIGSNDGEHDDPLRPFILAGQWKGILVEPVPYLFQRLRNNYRGRPGIVPVNVAVGLEDGTGEFFAIAQSEGNEELPDWYDQIGSFSREHILKHATYIPHLEERILTLEIPTLTFDTLFRQQSIDKVDVLHIDAEGYDFELLKAFDLGRRRPKLLMFEWKHLSEDDLKKCRQLLDNTGYDTIDVAWDTIAIRRDVLANRASRLARAWRTAIRQVRRSDG